MSMSGTVRFRTARSGAHAWAGLGAGPWAAIDLSLAAALAWCVLAPLPRLVPARARTAPDRDLAAQIAAPPGPSAPIALADLTARPLFSVARRPGVAADATAAADAEAALAAIAAATPPPVLIGIIHADADALAVLRDPVSGTALRLRPHQRIGGWEVVAIAPTAVRLRPASGGELRLDLHDPGSTAAATQAVPAATPAPHRAPPRTAAR